MRSGGINWLFAPISGEEPRHLDDGAVEDVERELRCDPEGEHEQGHGNDDELFASKKIRKAIATFSQGTAEEHLNRAQESHGGEEQAEEGHGGRDHREAERAFENEELADEAV